MVQWDTEDDKGGVYYVQIDDLSWENGGSRHDSHRKGGLCMTRIGFRGKI